MKFTLISDHELDGPKITYEFEEEFLGRVVDNIEQFLKGSGFVFETLEVSYDEAYSSESDWDEDEEEEDTANDEEKPFVVFQDDNMSATWPFPLNRPSDTITLSPGKE